MLFRQKKQPNLWGKIRLYLWPRRSFSRSLRYLGKRLLRIPARPHIVALGLAIGVFFAVTPLYGFHILLAVFCAWICSANIAAAALGTVLANPLTIPFLFGAAYETGRLILPIAHKAAPIPVLWVELQKLNFSNLSGVLFQISVGSLLLGIILAALAYIGAYTATRHFRRQRQKRIHARYLRRSAAGAVCRNGGALADFSPAAEIFADKPVICAIEGRGGAAPGEYGP
ncbi:MAG: DUF2062 domain-containing protein [Candidatus Tokpelaia sp.]|nr:MAG: DUF2062 domain-containing protein [Candidatus Tokpelaia sp.]KAA6206920.1 MAG: DUF2062 domain-containing protein [Candidatus Tokpelaia sp.]